MPHLLHPSPLGPITLTAVGGLITGLGFGPGRASRPGASTGGDDARVLAAAADQLDEYFAGTRQRFELPLGLAGSDFSRRVWEALLEIPYGTTMTYGRLAAALPRPTGRLGAAISARAVASAIARTPVPIIVPCHRVIGADGSLRGYLGGLDAKRRLLDLEAGRADLPARPVAELIA